MRHLLQTSSGDAPSLVEELLHGGPELEVGLRRDGTRITLRSFEGVLDDASPRIAQPIGKEDVVVVSGGAKGIGRADDHPKTRGHCH